MRQSYKNALVVGLISSLQMAFFLLPTAVNWRVYISVVGGAFIAPWAVTLHLPNPPPVVAEG